MTNECVGTQESKINLLITGNKQFRSQDYGFKNNGHKLFIKSWFKSVRQARLLFCAFSVNNGLTLDDKY